MSKVEECTVTVTRDGFCTYWVAVSCAGPAHLAVRSLAMTRRGAARLGRRIARDHMRRQGASRSWTFSVRGEVKR